MRVGRQLERVLNPVTTVVIQTVRRDRGVGPRGLLGSFGATAMLSTFLLPILIVCQRRLAARLLSKRERRSGDAPRGVVAWSRRVTLKVSTPGKANPCVVKGDILWNGDSFILTPQTNDPDEVYFVQSRRFDNDGNFIARGDGFIITYSALQKRLQDRDGCR